MRIMVLLAVMLVGCSSGLNGHLVNGKFVEMKPGPAAPAAVASTPAAPTTPAPVCTSSRDAVSTAIVSCRSFADSKPAWEAVMDESIRQAAIATLSAGKTHFVRMSGKITDIHFEGEGTEPKCESHVTGLGVVAVTMQALGQALGGGKTRATCRNTYGKDYECEISEPPAPTEVPRETVCTGGPNVKHVTSIDQMETFELIDAAEAQRRDNPSLPAMVRPLDAALLLRAMSPNAKPIAITDEGAFVPSASH